ncbi:hypothetical protein Dsin_022525 [Dipteronia sinensis]|uniref:Uncharacterized protein n=1 Tax=Dipteronia sinensis TaxID=43782 RepID=A0AAE0A1N5_9ROSI|nr:hypothetical protein Dsin_022525 [Dipteronia sinensis]
MMSHLITRTTLQLMQVKKLQEMRLVKMVMQLACSPSRWLFRRPMRSPTSPPHPLPSVVVACRKLVLYRMASSVLVVNMFGVFFFNSSLVYNMEEDFFIIIN